MEFPSNLTVDENTTFLPLVQCPNPEHATDKRHFQINVEKPLVHCFANCGISGTYEHALAIVTGETHRAVRKRIFKHSRIGAVSKRRKRGVHTTPTISPSDLRYETYLPPAATEYLASRGISADSIARWELGWDSHDLRIVIPVMDARGRLLFTIRRATRPKDQPKYLYPDGSERNHVLFGARQIDPGLVKSQGIVLVEGSLDTIVQHQNGFPNTGGILGSKLSTFQARIIANMRPKRIYTMFDRDAAGVGATISVTDKLRNIPIYVCRYPEGVDDPGEFTERQARRSIEKAIPASEFHRKVGISRSKPRRRKEQVG